VNDPVEIRVAGESDVEAIQTVYRRASLSNEGDRAALLAHPDALDFDPAPVVEGLTRVAVSGGRVVGFATARADGADALELDDLFVDPDHRRRGIAAALVHEIERRARSAGVSRIDVTANEHALDFYRSVGFTPAGTTVTRFGPAPRMTLDLGKGMP
jgi:GNAT superfamily N-acetyltransferase